MSAIARSSWSRVGLRACVPRTVSLAAHATPALRCTNSSRRCAAFAVPNDAHSLRTFRTSAVAWSQPAWASKGPIDYNEVKPLALQPSGDVTIIDVREPDEVAAGMIPSAVSVPLTQFEKAFDPNGGANFQRDFAFDRPAFDDKLVFYCRSGKRSAQAQEIARRNGWTNSRNYEGSYLDWVSHKEQGE